MFLNTELVGPENETIQEMHQLEAEGTGARRKIVAAVQPREQQQDQSPEMESTLSSNKGLLTIIMPIEKYFQVCENQSPPPPQCLDGRWVYGQQFLECPLLMLGRAFFTRKLPVFVYHLV